MAKYVLANGDKTRDAPAISQGGGNMRNTKIKHPWGEKNVSVFRGGRKAYVQEDTRGNFLFLIKLKTVIVKWRQD